MIRISGFIDTSVYPGMSTEEILADVAGAGIVIEDYVDEGDE